MAWTRTEVARLLRERGIRLRKSLGQNFLVDANFLDAIVREAQIGPRDGVVEIGSGIGNLTERLAAKAGHVWAFEIDRRLFEIAVEGLGGRSNVTLANVDGAEFAGHVDAGLSGPLKIVSNLPYSDYYRILLRALSTPLSVEGYYLMLQADVCDRLSAGPGDDAYGPISVIVGGLFEMKVLRRAGRRLFYPEPRVDSVFFRLRPRAGTNRQDIPDLEAGLRTLFAQRRKQLGSIARRLNVRLAGHLVDLAERRVETLEPPTLLDLAALVDR